jgi:hypothetical protein
MEEGTGDKVDVEVADRVSLSAGSQKPRFAPCGHRMRVDRQSHWYSLCWW